MKNPINWTYVLSGAAVVLAIASIMTYRTLFPDPFEFNEMSSYGKFRILTVEGQTTRFNPILGSLEETAPANSPRTAAALCTALLRDEGSPSVGNPDAKLNVVEFFDYRCPFCKVLAKMMPRLQEKADFRMVYKEWPILGDSSQLATRAALAADRQGQYRAVHERLMAAGFIPTMGYLESIGTKLGLDIAQWKADMQSPDITASLERNQAVAKELGLVGTPVLIVGRTIVQGAISEPQLARLIELEASLPPICPS